MITITARFNQVAKDQSPYESLHETAEFLQRLEDAGECYALGIYDPKTKTMHIPNNMNIAGQAEGEVLAQKMEQFNKLGFKIDKIEFYANPQV
jgi:hypothetical protein